MTSDHNPATASGGLADQLGFAPRPANRVRRLQQHIGAWPPVARIASWFLDPVDSALASWTGGTLTVPGLFAGMPVAFLTTVGARTGRERRNPVVPIPFEDGLGLLGTNYGRNITPAWAINLRANPDAELTYRSATAAVRAEPVEGDRLDALIAAGIPIFSGFGLYPSRITERALPGFILRPRRRGRSPDGGPRQSG